MLSHDDTGQFNSSVVWTIVGVLAILALLIWIIGALR